MSVILDASAALAIFFEEPGADVALARSRHAIISAVNMDEVLHKCERRGLSSATVTSILAKLEVTVVSFDLAQAEAAARLHPAFYRKDISFGDRACFALAEVTGRIILSADGGWKEVALPVEVIFIR